MSDQMKQKQKRRAVQNPEIREATAKYLKAKYRAFWNKYFQETGHAPEQKDFAVWLNVAPPSLSRWMNGQGLPNDLQKREIAKRLGTGIYIATGTTELVPDDRRVRELLDDWFELSEEQQEELLSEMRAMASSNARHASAGGGA